MSRDWFDSLGITLVVSVVSTVLGLLVFLLIIAEVWLFALLAVGGFLVLWVFIHFGTILGKKIYWWSRGYRNGRWS